MKRIYIVSSLFFFLSIYCKAQYDEIDKEQFKDPVNLGPNINSKYDESAPWINPLGDKLYFISRRKSRYNNDFGDADQGWGEDLYQARKVNGVWQASELLPEPINSVQNDGVATFSGDGQLIIYTVGFTTNELPFCNLYTSRYLDGSWSKPVALDMLNDPEAWDSHPSLSADGKTIIFSSSRAGGYGVTDLYISRKNIYDQWGKPENLGPEVNSRYAEYSPFLSQDGKTLYFSTDRPGGFGKLDVYKISLEDKGWSDLQNMGKGVNSSGLDYFFSIVGNGSLAYITSSRKGSLGGSDIFSIEVPEALRPKPTTVITGVVKDGVREEFADAVISLKSGNDFLSYYTTDSEDGSYLIVLEADKSYTLTYRMRNGAYYQEVFKLKSGSAYETIQKDVLLMPFKTAGDFSLGDIYFDSGAFSLSDSAKKQLDKLVQLFRDNPGMRMEILGHTDSVGTNNANWILSRRRAESVRVYLHAKGVEGYRMKTKAMGETIPAFSNDLASGRANNRRVELVILK